MVYKKRIKKRKFVKRYKRQFKKGYKRRYGKRKLRSNNRGFKQRISKFSKISNIPHRSVGLHGHNHDVCLSYTYRQRYTAQSGTSPATGDAYIDRGPWWTELFQSRPLNVRTRSGAFDMANDYPTYGGNYAGERCNAMKITVRIDPYVGANWLGCRVYIIPIAGTNPAVSTIAASDLPNSYQIAYIEAKRIHKKMIVVKDVSSVKSISMIIKPTDFNRTYDKRDPLNFRRTLTQELCQSDLGFMVMVVPTMYTDTPSTAYVAWQADITVDVKLYMSFAFKKVPDVTLTTVTAPADKTQDTKMTNESEQLSIFSNTNERVATY